MTDADRTDIAPEDQARVERDRQMILAAKQKGTLAKLGTYTRLSGPGWLQSAITLGGGSLASSLYLGILAGFAVLWLQPLAMILGVIMLSAIGYVTLSTGERPFDAINKHVNPVLGWGWAVATLMANLVWAMPQFSLGTSSLRNNLIPSVLGPAAMDEFTAKLIVAVGLFVISGVIVWFYDTGSRGIKLFEILLKIMVAVIVLSFFGVVLKMSFPAEGKAALDWGAIGRGLVPDLRLLMAPARTFDPFLQAVAPQFRSFWSDMIVSQQRDVMISATATAVGINMTFLLPYSMLKRGWGRDFRGLAIFDLSTGLFIPFILATGCVVMASASQFHATAEPGLLGELDQAGKPIVAPADVRGKYEGLAAARLKQGIGPDAFAGLSPQDKAAQIAALPAADRRMAAMLIKRDAFDLAQSLSPLTGKVVAHYVFGIGVVGMAVSSIIILMLINGFVVCEMLGRPSTGWVYRFACLAPGATGLIGSLLWKGTPFWLAMPTSVFGMTLIPIAYITFAMLMNSRGLLGRDMPKGPKRLAWNVLMLAAAGTVTYLSAWCVWTKTRWIGLAIVGAYIGLALVVQIVRKAKARAA